MSAFQQDIQSLAGELLGPESPFIYQQFGHYRPVESQGALGTPMLVDPPAPLDTIDGHLSPLNSRDAFEVGASQGEVFATITLIGDVEVSQRDYFLQVGGDGTRWIARSPGINVENASAITTVGVEAQL